MKSNIKMVFGIMAVSGLFGCIFWVVDSSYSYYMFSARVRYLLFQEPLSFLDSLILNIPPHDLFVRISFFTACIAGGLLISKFISDLKRSERRTNELYRLQENLLKSGSFTEKVEHITDAVDSGYDHVFVRCDPERYIRQINLFHNLFQFKRLGIIYENTIEGKSYAALSEVQMVARKRGFQVIKCIAGDNINNTTLEKAKQNVVECIKELAPQIDAFYVTAHRGLSPDLMPEILKPFFDNRVATWSQAEADFVERGVLLSMTKSRFAILGVFYANTIANIFNGAKPRSLNQVFEEPKGLALNLETAEIIGYKPPLGLLAITEKVFEKITGRDSNEK